MLRKLTFLLLLGVSLVATAEVHQREYGVATTIPFVLYDTTTGGLDVDEADGGSEVTLYCDDAAGSTATNDFVDEGPYYSIALSATEMECARLAIEVAATDTNVVFVETIGNASAAIDDDGSWYDSIPWNSAYDAEVQSEVADGLTAYSAVATTDLPTNFGDLSITSSTGRVDVASIAGTAQTANDNGADLNAILVDTGTTLDGKLDAIDAIVDNLALEQHVTTIATLSSQTSWTLTAGSADNDAYNGWEAIVIDQSTSTQVASGMVQDYVGSTRTVTLMVDPGVFTMATGDTVVLRPANANVRQINCYEVTADGTSGTEWAGSGDGGC